MKKTKDAIKKLFDMVDETKETLLILHVDENDQFESHVCGDARVDCFKHRFGSFGLRGQRGCKWKDCRARRACSSSGRADVPRSFDVARVCRRALPLAAAGGEYGIARVDSAAIGRRNRRSDS